MTDKELLEQAARAAGVELAGWNDGAEPYSSGEGFILPSNRLWNPLTDDGDALRLAVKLEILELAGAEMILSVNQTGCPYATARRAIVRAAAEIEV